ncbi:MAG: hypothetical protein AAGA58_01320 [Verrucomicrobiota bacterium]
MKRFRVLSAILGIGGVFYATFSFAQEIPEDLIDDEHIREEFGINPITTPSIAKVFEGLESLGSLPYDRLKREIPERTPRDRALVALSLGALVADGFLIVQSEQIDQIEDLGKSMLSHAKILGAGMKLSQHSKSILASSGLGDWEKLKEELAETQSDVEAEMVMLRDVDIVHLISLGGWVRALEIVSKTALTPFDAEKAKAIERTDIIEYFRQVLQGLEPQLRQRESVKELTRGINELHALIASTAENGMDEKALEAIAAKATTLRALFEGRTS